MPGYDVLIAGAGAAGCVLAARLSEDSHSRVLLLEAGPDYPDRSSLPPEIARSAASPAFTHDWGHYSEPGRVGHPIHLPRGKVVGGSSATNAAGALRGSIPFDYDEWAALGNPGWSSAEVLPFFRRLETDLDFATPWHGQSGPIPIRRQRPAEIDPVHRAFRDACLAAGYSEAPDHNAPEALGVGSWPRNEVDGYRQSVALTYLASARDRGNLTIRPNAEVDRVLFERRRAAGVRLARTGETVSADLVILAAGSYGSPSILLRSGLGPAEELRVLGIEGLEDRPGVGRNLADHPLLGLDFAAPVDAPGDPWMQTLLTLRSARTSNGHDLQIWSAGPWIDPAPHFYVYVSLVKPRSRGCLRLRSVDPAVPPTIDLGYFEDHDDLSRLLEGVRIARGLARTPPLRSLVEGEIFPGTDVPDDPAALAPAVLPRVETYHHPVGTSRMAPPTDELAVVDARGRAFGVEGLAVVDASIMPTIPAANTHLPTLMLAERCAEWLTG